MSKISRRDFLIGSGLTGLSVVLARRLLTAGGSGGFAVPAAPTLHSLSSAPDGFWQNISDPRAAYYGGKTFLNWINGSDGTLKAAHWDHASQALSSPVTLQTPGADIHNSGSVLVRSSDHKVLVAWSAHDAATPYLAISSSAADASAFGAPVALDSQLGSSDYTYLSLFEISGTIYLFYRDYDGTHGRLAMSTSTDGGVTWAARTLVATAAGFGGNVLYWNIGSDGTKIHVVTTDTDRSDAHPSSLFHFYVEGGLYYQSDGTQITATLPFGTGDMTQVVDASGGPVACLGVCTTGPATLYKVWTGSTNLVYRAQWTGSVWAITSLTDTDGVIGSNQFISSGSIHQSDPAVAYVPVKVGTKFEMYRWTYSGSWSGTALTSGSSVDHAMPGTVKDAAPGLDVVWGAGTYTSDSSFSFGVTGWG